MENAGVIVGIVAGLAGFITGVFGAVFSVCQYIYQKRKDKEQAEKQDLKDRLFFLAQVIIDKDIPRESRQPFYDEYIAKGGNGTVIKFWLENK